jgi:hypothetical protein
MFRQVYKNRQEKAQSVLEHMIVIIFVVGALFVFQKYIVKGMAGRFLLASDTFSHGRRYLPGETNRCAFDFVYGTHNWYDRDCFEAQCDCTSPAATTVTCQSCITTTCVNPMCL